MENKIFLVLGIITTISGLLLIVKENYLIGISGSVVGLWLMLSNLRKIRELNQK